MTEQGVRRLSAILALDVAGYSAQMERDEIEAARQVAIVRMRVEDLARAHGGRIFNTAGDGVMAEFASAMGAVETAAALVEAADLPTIRIGVHVGEALVAGDDLLGHDVNVAARLEQLAPRGAALVSDAARQMLRGPMRERLQPAGERQLNKMEAEMTCWLLEPAARPRRAALVMPRRRVIVTALASAAAAMALFSTFWSTGLIGPGRDEAVRAALNDPAAMRAITAQVTASLVSKAEASQDTLDDAHRAVLTLASSGQPADQLALSFLHEGETAHAVRALETFGDDLLRRNQRADAAAAYGRAGALALFHDKTRAVSDFRRAYALDQGSVDRFADLLNGIASAEGYPAAFHVAETAIRSATTPNNIAAFALLYSAVMAGDLGDTQRQSNFIEQAAQRITPLGDPYLNAALLIGRGYLALGEQDMARARSLYMQGRAALARIPGHERDSQQGWLLALLAMGDLDTAWRDGQAFIAERENAGAPPQSSMILNTCIAGVMLGQARAAAPLCRAGAQGLEDGPNAATGHVTLGMLAAETGDLSRARLELDAARAMASYRTAPAVAFYAARLDANIAAREGDFAALEASVARTTRLISSTRGLRERAHIFNAALQSAFGEWTLALGQTARGCAALGDAQREYAAIRAEPGVQRMQRLRTAARCA